ncbi:unnamed protein product [Candidula unifasciata]|uniref:Fucosyltransferase n=1 Tax=Candidula unifasciata TaxID=100452 RepID=A0A8S3Z6C7_9EUPU|nr:unnamed protein product [Candidula unifasciata]
MHLRRSFSCMKLPNCRHIRPRLWFVLIGIVLAFFIINVLLNVLPLWVGSKHGVDSSPVNLVWLLPGLNPVSQPTTGPSHSGTSVSTMNLEAQYRSVMVSPDCRPPHMIWDTNLRHTDRIVEQLNYIPKRRRLFSSAHILVFEKGGGEEIPAGNTLFKNNRCLVDNCNITLDPKTDQHVDALVTSISISGYLLHKRRQEDVYVFYQLESPRSFVSSERMSGFNWTATYRHDSTIVTPYEKWVPFENNTNAGYFEGIDAFPESRPTISKNYADGKSKMAAALISNCMGKRMVVIHELTKYIRLDCLEMISRDYKFYLAFENANCVDYITEKFFKNALSRNVVPVVFGAPSSDYVRSAPPYSYIHVDNFPTVRHLASYLQELDVNDDMYNVYFKWKGTGSFINTKFWCRLCAMVNDLDKPYLIDKYTGCILLKWVGNLRCANYESIVNINGPSAPLYFFLNK